jgi:hypothetical protein
MRRPPLPVDALSANARIVDASFLESVVIANANTNTNNKSNKNKVGGSNKETVRRLARIVQVLQTDDSIDPARTDEWPGLSSLANLLVSGDSNRSSKQVFLSSPHKEVRLYSVLCCLELLGIFAPDLPGHWTTGQLLTIFTQTLQQVSNLSHCYAATDRHFVQYTRILDLLAEVKIGIILVELVVDASSSTSNHPAQTMSKNGGKDKSNKRRIQDDDIEDTDDDDDHDDDGSNDDENNNNNINHHDDHDISSSTPLEVLAEFFQTLLGCVRREHPGQIRDQVVNALAACLEEFDCSARLDTTSSTMLIDRSHSHGINIPIRIIDEILLCLGAGPTVTVNVMTAVAAPAPPPPEAEASSSKMKRGKKAPPPPSVPAPPPKAQLRTKLEPNPQYLVAAALLQKTANKTATPIAALLNTLLNSSDHSSLAANEHDISRVSSIVADPEMAFSDSHDDVWSIITQVHRVAPAVLITVIGTIGQALTSPEFHRRYASVRLLGQLFARKKLSSSSSMVVEYRSIFTQWLGRQSDIDVHVRKA